MTHIRVTPSAAQQVEGQLEQVGRRAVEADEALAGGQETERGLGRGAAQRIEPRPRILAVVAHRSGHQRARGRLDRVVAHLADRRRDTLDRACAHARQAPQALVAVAQRDIDEAHVGHDSSPFAPRRCSSQRVVTWLAMTSGWSSNCRSSGRLVTGPCTSSRASALRRRESACARSAPKAITLAIRAS